jgi:hypothetical protein
VTVKRALFGAALAACVVGVALLVGFANGADGAPRYKSCGKVARSLSRPVPVYASSVACSVARAVERRCWSSNCFGSLSFRDSGGWRLPLPPSSLPLGFACYQAFPPYTAGLPRPGQDNRWIVCERDRQLVQRVAYRAK